MKKLTKILALSFIIIMVTSMFASCGLFDSKMDKIEDRLDDEDYVVVKISSNSMMDSFVEEVLNMRPTDLNTPESVLAAYHEDDSDNAIIIIEFDNSIKALIAYFEDYKDAIKEYLDEEGEDYDLEFTYGIDGSIIYFGTVDAAKIALGFPANLFVFEK